MAAEVSPIRKKTEEASVSDDAAGFAADYLRRSAEVLAGVDPQELAAAIGILEGARAQRAGIYVCGNGGSAATASHLAAGLGNDASAGRQDRFRAMALTDNVPWMTALANDRDYSRVFVEQLVNHAAAGDVLIALSASGNSPNIMEAVRWANENGLTTVGITGRDGGELGRSCGTLIRIGTDHVGHIEEGHFLVQHLITYYFAERR